MRVVCGHKLLATWIDLDGDFDAEIRTNLRIAREQAAPNLMVVPLFGANGGK